MGPRPGYFVAALILGDRAIAEVRKSDLPPSLLNRIARAKRYAEGTTVRVEVKKIEDIEAVKTLAKIKAEF